MKKAENVEWKAFANTLLQVSKRTWRQLHTSGRHDGGTEKIASHSLPKKIRAALTPDVDFALAIRYDGRKPMICHKIDDRLIVLWLDREMNAYDHG